jgi:hypothetical protein
MDTFGGLYEPSLGLGTANSNGFNVDYHFPDVIYHNRFERVGNGWHWEIIEQAWSKPDRLFAEYKLRRASCRGMTFSF